MENLKIQFDIRSKELLKALSILSSAIPSSALVPIYTYVKVDGYKGSDKIFLTASDAKITIKTFAQVASIEFMAEETCFVMPFDEISRLLKSSPDGPVTVKYYHDIQKDGAGRTISDVYGIVIVAQTKEYTFAGEEASTFPVIQTLPKSSFKIDCAQLKEGIGYLKGLPVDLEFQQQYNGIYIDFKREYLTLVAFDSKMSIGIFETDVKSPEINNFTLPFKVMTFLNANLPNGSDVIEICVSEKQVSAEFGAFVIHSVLPDCAQFPAYRSDDPPGPDMTAKIEIDGWKAVLTRAMITANSNKEVVHNFQQDYCFVSSEDFLLNKKSIQDMLIIDQEGNPVEICLNGERLKTLISPVDGEALIHVKKPYKQAPHPALFIYPETLTGRSLQLFLMPIARANS